MAIRDQLARWLPPAVSQRFNLGQYPQFLQDYYSQFGYAGSLYPLGLNQSALSWSKTEEISASLPNYFSAIRRSPPAFAAQMVRASMLSMARFTFRSRPNSSTPRRVFGTQDLRPLEQPWTNATTGELISRMEWSAGLAGNAYVLRQPDRLRVLRPDWVAIIYGSNAEPDDPKGALDGEVIGYAYRNGGFGGGNKNEIRALLPEQVAHWSPLPDPLSPGLGMSWITPALRDIQADQSALEHKLAYFSNGATPNLVIKGLPSTATAQFKEWVDTMEAAHKGSANAFKTLYLTAGADATVVGSNLQQLDLTSITSHGETRVSYLSRVPAVLLGIAAGLKGSSLNAGNYAEARRNVSDTWVYPTLADLCAALSVLVNVPGGAELWFDVADIPLLREDAKDAAEIEEIKEKTIVAYVSAGFKPDSVIAAVRGQDISQLVHDDRFTSVQLQVLANAIKPPSAPSPPSNGATPEPQNGSQSTEPAPAKRSMALREDGAPMQMPMNFAINLPERMVTIENYVQPANAPEVSVPVTVNPAAVTVNPAAVAIEQPITVQPAEVTVPVTVSPAEVRIEQPLSLQPPDVNVSNQFDVQPANAPQVTVKAPITVNTPAVTSKPPDVIVNVDAAPPPNQGVEIDYDSSGRPSIVRPRRSRRA